ncbi:excinuclease ABC subunit UvrC [Caviibacter abscessus]|uniref:excinuclease ABC subunit UvrC n=1 Tax=Caviibacter abscessus TaxID=1766719 RepID=UPI000831A794|nr:excinuclease ABC subunit UvrC [Caviibacter abscessus]
MSIDLKHIPANAGVYIMKNKYDKIIYIGKAKNLKKRVSSYFNKTQNLKTTELVKNITTIDFFLCNSEIEALILENNLIKKHKPKYNILLKDQKTYPYIKITKELYPKISVVRNVSDNNSDKAYYFGPYPNTNMKSAVNMLMKVFNIRDCNINVYKNNLKPCLKYHINLCNAPCMYKDEDTINTYIENTKKLVKFLENKDTGILKEIENKMNNYSESFEFEKAIIERERLKTLQKLIEIQITEAVREYDEDIFVLNHIQDNIFLCIISVRKGKIINKTFNVIKNIIDDTDILDRLITAYYDKFTPPKIIVLSAEYKDKKEIIENWFLNEKKYKVKLIFPSKKSRTYDLLKLGNLNLVSEQENYYNKKENMFKNLIELKEILKLDKIPNKIECYDISNISGNDNVGSQVVFINGVKEPKLYKKYKIKTIIGQDDYGSMKEVIKRRIKYKDLPDLILLDGGKAHVNTIKKFLLNENINIAVFGMYKDNKHRTFGLCDENNIINLKIHKNLFNLITSFQDEVHRFAITYHKKLRSERNNKSLLDEISGIGKVRKKTLLNKFGTISNIKKASIDELKEILPESVAINLLEKL